MVLDNTLVKPLLIYTYGNVLQVYYNTLSGLGFTGSFKPISCTVHEEKQRERADQTNLVVEQKNEDTNVYDARQ